MNHNEYQLLKGRIHKLMETKQTVLIAVDGYCAAGKTSLAEKLQKDFFCNVIHMDDFYLPISKRDTDWETSPAKNIDFDRLKTVLKKIPYAEQYSYFPYLCHTASYGDEILHQKKPLTIVEGTYSCHPCLKEFYDLSVFLTVSFEEQKRRIIKRNGEEGYLRFYNLWIPLEIAYFESFAVKNHCNLIF